MQPRIRVRFSRRAGESWHKFATVGLTGTDSLLSFAAARGESFARALQIPIRWKLLGCFKRQQLLLFAKVGSIRPAFFCGQSRALRAAWMDVDLGRKRRRRKKDDRDARSSSKALTSDVRERIEGWAEEAADVYGLELFDIEIAPHWKIEVFVDKDGGFEPGGGVTIAQCAEVSRYVEALLDTDDSVPEKYTIEVSSPGVERKLKKPNHFAKVVGRTVRLVAHVPVDGQNVFEGELVAFDDPELTVEVDGESYTLTLGQLAKARLTYEF